MKKIVTLVAIFAMAMSAQAQFSMTPSYGHVRWIEKEGAWGATIYEKDDQGREIFVFDSYIGGEKGVLPQEIVTTDVPESETGENIFAEIRYDEQEPEGYAINAVHLTFTYDGTVYKDAEGKYYARGKVSGIIEGAHGTKTLTINAPENDIDFWVYEEFHIEPASAEQVTTIDFTKGDLNNPVTSLGTNVTANPDGSINIATTTPEEQIDEILETLVPGSSMFKYFLPDVLDVYLPAGEGSMNLDCQTFGYTIVVRDENGNILATISQNEQGVAVAEYNLAQETHVIIYLKGAPATAPARLRENETVETGANIYKVTIIPLKAITGIETVQNDNASSKRFIDGQLYILRNGKMYNIHGAEVQ